MNMYDNVMEVDWLMRIVLELTNAFDPMQR